MTPLISNLNSAVHSYAMGRFTLCFYRYAEQTKRPSLGLAGSVWVLAGFMGVRELIKTLIQFNHVWSWQGW